jgi:cell division topological specificity factor
LIVSILDLFLRRTPDTARLAKDRLQIVVARERASTGDRVQSYLPQLQQELLQVIAKYEKLDLDQVSVMLDKKGDAEVLEINIVLPEERQPALSVRTRAAWRAETA